MHLIEFLIKFLFKVNVCVHFHVAQRREFIKHIACCILLQWQVEPLWDQALVLDSYAASAGTEADWWLGGVAVASKRSCRGGGFQA